MNERETERKEGRRETCFLSLSLSLCVCVCVCVATETRMAGWWTEVKSGNEERNRRSVASPTHSFPGVARFFFLFGLIFQQSRRHLIAPRLICIRTHFEALAAQKGPFALRRHGSFACRVTSSTDADQWRGR